MIPPKLKDYALRAKEHNVDYLEVIETVYKAALDEVEKRLPEDTWPQFLKAKLKGHLTKMDYKSQVLQTLKDLRQ